MQRDVIVDASGQVSIDPPLTPSLDPRRQHRVLVLLADACQARDTALASTCRAI